MFSAVAGIVVLIAVTAAVASRESSKRSTAPPSYDHSAGRDHSGYWENLRALDYVEMFDYEGLEFPAEVHEITDEYVSWEIMALFENLPPLESRITDSKTKIKDGNRVIIDYVGKIDGKEFEGGKGNGVEVSVGVTELGDCVFDELIGRSPGDSVEIKVSFPEDYGANPDLSGKKAVYTVEIECIILHRNVEDKDVKEHFYESHGWKTVDQMRLEVYENTRKESMREYIRDYFEAQVVVTMVPLDLIRRVETSMLDWHSSEAFKVKKSLPQLIEDMGIEGGVDGLLEYHRETNAATARFQLIMQAVAESIELKVTLEDIEEYYGDRYSDTEQSRGIPFMAQQTLINMVFDYIIENAVLL